MLITMRISWSIAQVIPDVVTKKVSLMLSKYSYESFPY